jgi:hypothetical protein
VHAVIDADVGATEVRPMVARRRRTVVTIGVVAVGAAAFGGMSGSAAGWITAAFAGALLPTYCLLALRMRTLAGQEEMRRAFAPGDATGIWPPLDLLDASELARLVTARAARSTAGPRRPLLDRWEFTRVVWGGLAGSLLDVVAALTDRIIGDASQVGGRRAVWLDRSLRLQAHLQRQSRRALAASATATAGVAVVGAIPGGCEPHRQSEPDPSWADARRRRGRSAERGTDDRDESAARRHLHGRGR